MGIAYIVELLDQGSQLNSLHWFQSVWAKQVQERNQLETQKAKASKEDNKLQQALSLTEKRIKSIETVSCICVLKCDAYFNVCDVYFTGIQIAVL